MKALLIFNDAPWSAAAMPLASEGSHRSSMDELAQLTTLANKILVF